MCSSHKPHIFTPHFLPHLGGWCELPEPHERPCRTGRLEKLQNSAPKGWSTLTATASTYKASARHELRGAWVQSLEWEFELRGCKQGNTAHGQNHHVSPTPGAPSFGFRFPTCFVWGREAVWCCSLITWYAKGCIQRLDKLLWPVLALPTSPG